MQPGVVELDDTGNNAIDPNGHEDGDGAQHRDLLAKRRIRYGAQRDHDDLSGKNKVGADGALDFFFLDGDQIDGGVDERLQMFLRDALLPTSHG